MKNIRGGIMLTNKRTINFLALVLCFLFLVSSNCFAYEKELQTISDTIEKGIEKSGKKTISVVDFTDLQGNITELGRFIAEEISVNLINSANNFEIIDRIHLATILKEHKLEMSGLVDPETVKELGKIAGVDAIVTGTVTPFGDSVRVTCKVITTQTAKVVSAAKIDIAKTKAIEELLASNIETENNTANSNTVPHNTTPNITSSTISQSVEAKGFVFELQGCKNSGGSITCNFLITNKEDDKDLIIWSYGYSRIIDDSGNEFIASNATLGSSSGSATLVTGISTKASLSFDEVKGNPSFIALLEIVTNNGKVQFRNVSLSK